MPALRFIVISPSFTPETLAKPMLAISAARAGAIGVLDSGLSCTAEEVVSAFIKLQHHAGNNASVGIKLAQQNYRFLPLLAEVSSSSASQKVHIILCGGDDGFDTELLRKTISEAHASGFVAIVEAISVEEALIAQAVGADAVIAKGYESSGRTGDTTAFVLMQQFVRTLTVPVWAQGGIGTHSIAAVAASGACGAVLDAQLYLCRDSQLAPELKLRLDRFDGTEPNQLWGQDGCLAKAIATKGGTVSGALDHLADTAGEYLHIAATKKTIDAASPLASSHGTTYPIVQGAMTRVSDTSEFAFQVAQGGALPFLALSLMRGTEIDKLMTETQEKLGSQSWGVGLLGFVPQQLRQEQWEVVTKHKPPFALIAGGRPDQAKALEEQGTKTYLHVPSPLLLKSFIEMGSKRFIFEGRECGGHVGPRSSMVLWDTMIEVLLETIGPKEDASNFHILFAGGIHDDLSAAMVAAMAAPLNARGIKTGVLVGTAYLFTEEAVSSGAIVQTFQDEALKCKSTVLLETGPGHTIRCIPSPYKKAFDNHREDLERQNKSRDEIREDLEMMNLGRLRIASKGVERAGGKLEEIPVERQWQEGMYMIGQVAAMRNEPTTIAALHKNICEGGQQLLQDKAPLANTPGDYDEIIPGEPIAIVGMSCQFPKANDIDSYWQNILDKVDTIEEIPESHFDWKNYYDPNPLARDKVVSKWGGFLQDITFDPAKYGIPPSTLDSVDPMQMMLLEASRNALEDAGYSNRKFPRDKTSVILANAGHGPITALYSLRSMLGWKLSDFDEPLKEKLQERLPEWTEDSFAGYLGNVTAGRVANRFDLKGINFSIDAACASSLAALYVAMNDLRSGASDVVLLGATDTHNQPGDYLSFSKTHALSTDGRCKTFDASADGIVISEGIAILVLKRLSDAEKAGDRIYAVIRGIGGSSDGRDLSLTAPRPAGQMLALERAYADAGIEPSTVTLIEAHGTGTVAGDKAEVEALTTVFQRHGAGKETCAIGSVKTNIGHTKAAAGLASIIKVAKSLHHRILPPTIHVKTPNPACGFGKGPFYINSERRPWLVAGAQEKRRAGVSAFGFGGTNFHAVLEEYTPPLPTEAAPNAIPWSSELFVWKARTLEQLLKQIAQTELAANSTSARQLDSVTTKSDERTQLLGLASKLQLRASNDVEATVVLAIVASSIADLLAKIAEFRKHTVDNSSIALSSPQKGIHFAPSVQRRTLAFMFPGQGSQRPNMLRELMFYFPQLQSAFELFNDSKEACLEKPLTDYIFPPPVFEETHKKEQSQRLTATEVAQPAIGACSLALLRTLQSLGVKPDMVAGHSYGEYVALHAGGILSSEDLVTLSFARGKILASCAQENPGSMAAVSAAPEEVARTIESINSVYIANVNSPSQCIISGTTAAVDEAIRRFNEQKLACTRVPVSAAFHTPLMSASQKALEDVLKQITIDCSTRRIPVWTNTTASVLPDDSEFIRKNLTEHALKPVLFAQQVQSMHKAGASLFVEVGPGTVLTNLVTSTLKGSDIRAISTDGGGHALEQFLNVIACLVTNGNEVDLRKLFWSRVDLARTFTDDKPAVKASKLLYKVNSVRMERIGAEKKPATPSQSTGASKSPTIGSPSTAGNNGFKTHNTGVPTDNGSSTPVGKQNAVSRPTGTNTMAIDQSKQQQNVRADRSEPRQTRGRNEGSVERVMLDFQQSMLQMTNQFLQTQQNVMLAYLQANRTGSAQIDPALLNTALLPMSTNGSGDAPQLQAPAYSINQQTNAQQQPAYIHTETQTAPETSSFEATQESAQPAQAHNSSEDLVEKLFEIVSDRTGYPREMLDPQLDMEADLGIDSIKRVEILNNFRKLLPDTVQTQLENDIEALASTKTLQGVIDWLNKFDADATDAPKQTPSTVAPKPPAAETTAVAQSNIATVSGKREDVARGLVATKSLPPIERTKQEVKGKIVIAAAPTNDQALALAKLLKAERYQVELLDVTAFHKTNTTIDPKANISTLIHFADAGVKALFQLTKKFEPIFRNAAAHPNHRTAFINITRIDGNFGLVEPSTTADLLRFAEEAATVGFTKTIAKEWPSVHVKALDFPANAPLELVVSATVKELLAEDGEVEVGYRSGERTGIEVVAADIRTAEDSSLIDLDSSSVILITGGARGITAEIAIEMGQKYRPTFLIVGRSAKPSEPEHHTTANLNSPREIKAALIEIEKAAGREINIRSVERAYQQLLSQREIRRNLAAIEATGARVKYYSVDVSDDTKFGAFLDSVQETVDIAGVIHGAGIIEDALIKDKSEESFDRVFYTKINCAITLSKHLRFDTLKFLFFFSSVVGRTGNAGQCDYVSANEALNKIARVLQTKTKARVASLMWGPWRAGMAPPELEEVFASHGWAMIQPISGRLCFREEVLLANTTQPEVLLVGKLAEPEHRIIPQGAILKTARQTASAAPAFALSIDVDKHRYLQDHKFDGIPVMPMAVALETMLEAAKTLHPSGKLRQVKSLDIPAGIVFHTKTKDFTVETETAQDGSLALQLRSIGTPGKVHFRCKAVFETPATNDEMQFAQHYVSRLGNEIPWQFDANELGQGEPSLPRPKDVYGTWLFHGPLFQGIQSVDWMTPIGICGRVNGSRPADCLTTADGDEWILDPVLLDSAMQLAGIWARKYHDVTVLPAGFRSLKVFGATPLQNATARIFLSQAMATELLCDLAIYDANGNLALVVEELGGIASKAFNRFSAQAPVEEFA